jgi:ATP-dependent DNA ligase
MPSSVPDTAQIPKCEKGRSIESALKMIAGPEGRKTKEIWAETKYDGERLVLTSQRGPCLMWD